MTLCVNTGKPELIIAVEARNHRRLYRLYSELMYKSLTGCDYIRVRGYSPRAPGGSSIDCTKSGNSASIKPSSSTPSSFGS